MLYLSTITPVYSARPYLEQLVREIDALRQRLEREELPIRIAEAIFVDDASSDGSSDLLADLASQHSWLRVVQLSRNFGQHPATIAGVLHTSSDWVATLDEDLQHRPSFIVDLLAQAAESSADLVYARPEGKVHGFFRDAASRTYKRFVAWFVSNPEVRNFNSFRLIRGSIARAAAAVSSHETYFDIALCWFTDRISTVSLPLEEQRAERNQKSGYSFRALLHHARRMLVSSQIKPLRLGGALGFVALGLSLAGSAAAVVLKLLYPELIRVQGWTSLALIMLFFGGLLSLLASIALEYLSDLHLQALGRPAFFVVDRSQDSQLEPLRHSRTSP